MARLEYVKNPKHQGKKRKHENKNEQGESTNNKQEDINDEEMTTKVPVQTDLAETKQKNKTSKHKQENSKEKWSKPQEEKGQKLDEPTPEGTNSENGKQKKKKNKAGKRKQAISEGADIKEKRHKSQEENKRDDTDNDDEHEEPTAAQLQEAAKPENSNAIITVRQKKKQKHLQRLEAQKDQHADKDIKRNDEYLNKWKNSRQDWKFNKLRQISIQKLAFDEEKLNPEMWPIALEYLASSKGAAKEIIIKLAENVIQSVDKECDKLTEESAKQQLINSSRYQRARDLLQSFD